MLMSIGVNKWVQNRLTGNPVVMLTKEQLFQRSNRSHKNNDNSYNSFNRNTQDYA